LRSFASPPRCNNAKKSLKYRCSYFGRANTCVTRRQWQCGQ
jgi:hypothetical protein